MGQRRGEGIEGHVWAAWITGKGLPRGQRIRAGKKTEGYGLRLAWEGSTLSIAKYAPVVSLRGSVPL